MRNHDLHIRVTDDEHARVKAAAAFNARTVADWSRLVLDREAKKVLARPAAREYAKAERAARRVEPCRKD